METMNAVAGAGPVRIEFEPWREEGEPDNPRTLLFARGRLGGTLLLAEAIEIADTEDGEQRAADPRHEERLDRYWGAFAMDGTAEPVAIDGREYVVFVAPGC